MTILVLGGGNSTERAVSLRSAAAVTKALRQAGFKVNKADPLNGLTVLDSLRTNTLIFPILHGAGGEDGEIQKELEIRELPYLGTKSQPSAVCFDKWQTRQALEKADLPVAKGDLVTRQTYLAHVLAKQPHVLKTTRGGSSIGTLIAREPNKVQPDVIDEVFALGEQAVLEELIEGVEITVPIYDTKALPVIEIKPPSGEEYDYNNKYTGPTELLCPPISIDEAAQAVAQRLAEQAHKVLNCRHFSRVDMIVRDDKKPIILEVNTIPGMTDHSLYPKSALAAGMDFPDLMKHFVQLVQRDYGIKE